MNKLLTIISFALFLLGVLGHKRVDLFTSTHTNGVLIVAIMTLLIQLFMVYFRNQISFKYTNKKLLICILVIINFLGFIFDLKEVAQIYNILIFLVLSISVFIIFMVSSKRKPFGRNENILDN